MRCYCSMCRKTAGSGGFAINLGAVHATLKVQGQEHLSVYRAKFDGGGHCTGRRHFYKHCGTALWPWDPTWPELVHPHAGAIDTPLPRPPGATHMMLGSKPARVAALAMLRSMAIPTNRWPSGIGGMGRRFDGAAVSEFLGW
jgi:hypothetical protein